MKIFGQSSDSQKFEGGATVPNPTSFPVTTPLVVSVCTVCRLLLSAEVFGLSMTFGEVVPCSSHNRLHYVSCLFIRPFVCLFVCFVKAPKSKTNWCRRKKPNMHEHFSSRDNQCANFQFERYKSKVNRSQKFPQNMIR